MTYTYETNLDGAFNIEVDVELEKGMTLYDISPNEVDSYYRVRKVGNNEIALKPLKQKPDEIAIPFNRIYVVRKMVDGVVEEINTYSWINAYSLVVDLRSNRISAWRV